MREAGRERRQGGNTELMRQKGARRGAREREGGGDTNAKQETGTRQSDF